MRVFVYWNLHKKCWSIKALQGRMRGKVIAHLNDFILENVTFKVSESGRQRVLRERRKNVHAGVVGILIDKCDMDTSFAVTYDPYKYSTFVKVKDLTAIDSAKCCFSIGKKIFAIV